jgi:iron-sulfur cluster assembly accessory protein
MAEPTDSKSGSPVASEIQTALTSGVVAESLQVRLSATALEQAERLAADPGCAGKPLRIYLEGKGCDGFFYGVAFSDLLPNDLTYRQGMLTLVIDRETFPFVAASQVDWADDERGRGFLVDNPNHKRFRGKFFKRKAWQDYFTEQKSGRQTSEASQRP